MSRDIPPMTDWQAFERLCRDLWSRIWADPDAKMHGRSPQKQHGVDVYGRPGRGPEWAGVQCKLRSQIAGARLTRGQIEAEARKAETFEPAISSFIVATTASRDAIAQKAEREITDERLARGAFPVSVWAWEDILAALEEHPELVDKHLSLKLPGDRSGNVRDDYLRAQWSRLLPVPMLGLGRSQEDVPLSAIYTALDVTAEIRVGGKGRAGLPLPGSPRSTSRGTAVAASSAVRRRPGTSPGERRFSSCSACLRTLAVSRSRYERSPRRPTPSRNPSVCGEAGAGPRRGAAQSLPGRLRGGSEGRGPAGADGGGVGRVSPEHIKTQARLAPFWQRIATARQCRRLAILHASPVPSSPHNEALSVRLESPSAGVVPPASTE